MIIGEDDVTTVAHVVRNSTNIKQRCDTPLSNQQASSHKVYNAGLSNGWIGPNIFIR